MENTKKGYREIDHTADWELQVWAPDVSGLFQQAALGMLALAHTKISESERDAREMALTAYDQESLLVTFLTELIFITEQEGIGFDRIDVSVLANTLVAHLEGGPIVSQAKDIKAVTFHNLEIRETQDGYRVNIVLDV
jgi:SHS2 domain-containing protein